MAELGTRERENGVFTNPLMRLYSTALASRSRTTALTARQSIVFILEGGGRSLPARRFPDVAPSAGERENHAVVHLHGNQSTSFSR